MAGERKITVKFDGKDVGLKRAANDAEGDLDRFGRSAASTGGILAGGLFGGAALAAGGMAVLGVAAAKEEQSQASLAQTMRNVTGATDEQVAATEAAIEAMQDQTGLMDDDLRTAYVSMLAATGDATTAQEGMTTVMDIAAARNISAAEAADILSAASRGEMDAIQNLGIATEDAAGEALSFDQIMANAADTFGGQAAVAAETTAGKFQILKTKLGEVGEDLGAKLLPAALSVGSWLTDSFIPAVTVAADWLGTNLGPAVSSVAAFMRDDLAPAIPPVLDVLSSIGTWIAENKPLLIGLGVAIGVGLVIAFGAWAVSAAAAAAATIAATWPVLAIGAAIALLVAGIVWAYENWGWFREAVDTAGRTLRDTVWPAIKGTIDWLVRFGSGIVRAAVAVGSFIADFARAFARAYTTVSGFVSGAISMLASIPGRIASVFSGVANIITSPFKAGFESIRTAWNNSIGGKGISFGGSWGIPKVSFSIPRLHTGGIFTPNRGGSEGLALLSRGEGVFTPDQMAALGRGAGGGADITISSGGTALDDLLVEVLRKGIRNRGGNVQAVLG